MKCEAFQAFYLFHEFNKFKETGVRRLDTIYHMQCFR